MPNPLLEKRLATDIPGIPYPPGGNAMNCPVSYTNFFYQGIQKRSDETQPAFSFGEETKLLNYTFPPDVEIEELRKRSLEPRQYATCTNIARFDWEGFNRPLGNTQDLYLSHGSTYTFSISSDVSIKLAYAWVAPFGGTTYSLIATGGNGGQTATVVVNLSEDSHIHFQAFSDYTMSNGAVALFKQDYASS